MARGVVNRAIKNMQEFDSLDFSVSVDGPHHHWEVDYSGVWQGDEARKASGFYTSVTSGKTYEFNSDNFLTCYRQIEPSEGEWRLSAHTGWDRANNPNTFTPFAPLGIFRENPQSDWLVDEVTEREVVVDHAPDDMTGLHNVVRSLKFSKDPILLLEFATTADGQLLATVSFFSYGVNFLEDAFTDPIDCMSRN